MTFDVDSLAGRIELETLLSGALGGTVTLARVARLTPWAVARCQLRGQSGSTPPSVIVKWLRRVPTGFRTDPAQLLTEEAALTFLSDIGVDVAPRLVVGDARLGIVVLEVLTPRQPLYALLACRDPSASASLMAFAHALGTLHAATVGLADTYYSTREALGPVDRFEERTRFLGERSRETCATFEQLGVPMHAAASEELATLQAILPEPGPFLALSNGDAGLNNFLATGSDGRIIDFEFAGYRHALADAQCLHVPNSLWLTVGDPVHDGTEDEYRRTLSAAVAEAEDDRVFGLGMAAGCLGMAVERLSRFSKVDARAPGDESRVQLVSTLQAACRGAEHHGSLPQLTGWVHGVIELLRERWPDADADTAQFEPFTPRR